MATGNISVLIADDHELIREGLKRALLDQGQARHVGEARDAGQALELVRKRAWDVVLLDICLPGRSGLEVLKEIKREKPRLPVILLSMYPEEQFGVRGMRAGADGYLNKATGVGVLREAIQTVLRGGKYVTPTVAAKLVDAVQHPGNQPLHETLSDRENQVFQLIASGRTVGEIAAQLHLSVKTISTHRGNILRKLGVQNNAQIMRYAHEHGLVGGSL